MRVTFIQFAGLVAALTFANQYFAGRPAWDALTVAFVSALLVYAVLSLGDIAVQRILEFAEPAGGSGEEPESDPRRADPPSALAA